MQRSIRSFSETSPSAKIADQFLLSLLLLVLAALRMAMKPGARFGIIDRNGTGADHGLDEKILREEVEHAGFHQVGRYDFTKDDGQDYFLIFEKS